VLLKNAAHLFYDVVRLWRIWQKENPPATQRVSQGIFMKGG